MAGHDGGSTSGQAGRRAVRPNESVSVYLTRLVTGLSDAENLHIVKYFEDAFQRYHIHKQIHIVRVRTYTHADRHGNVIQFIRIGTRSVSFTTNT